MSKQTFPTIRSEGALFPPDVLVRIADLKVDSVSADSYHLPASTKHSEAISRSWALLKQHWETFKKAKEALDDSAPGGTVTNDRWLLPLFSELGYGRLTTVTSPEIEGKSYPVQRFYQQTPIHFVGCNVPLDRRSKGVSGAAKNAPHSMIQEFLNRSDQHLWALVSNGLRLRVLRDNIALSRQAFVEFDLESMMEGEVYSDFAILWLLCHQSRVEADKPEECHLESWSKIAREDGTRVLSQLRDGVADSIEALGQGFIEHPKNDLLRERLRSGTLDTQDYYRQLLRTVYRLLFLFVAEDRKLLHAPDADALARELYDKFYSTRRLRELADKIRGSKHSDLWYTLSLTFQHLSSEEGCKDLGLTGLGSFLWNSKSTPDLLGPHETAEQDAVFITNDNLLTAVRKLAYVERDKVRRQVDYRNLGSEELGSVYESLLELHPEIHIEAARFELRTSAGNERKTSGSYYTPDSLVQCLLDSALEPVVEDRLKGKKGADAEDAILSIKVCDPACGSGHFLIAAAHRLARHLAQLRTGETEPSPEDHQHALRDVIGRCIYGVDLNPMAVELCKVSLWMEATEPGKPLSFLDSHIQQGNSLLGTTPKLLTDGIPDDAFKAIEGDDKQVVANLKKRNKAERKDRIQGQQSLFSSQGGGASLASQFSEIAEVDDSTIAGVADKEDKYGELLESEEYQNSQFIADAWCSAFVWKKDESDEGKLCPTDQDFTELKENPPGASVGLKSGVRNLSQQYQFFHWHLAFPDVFVLPEEEEQAENEQTGWSSGFDVVLGNPPWEHTELKEKEWFATRATRIATAKTGAQRKKLIQELKQVDPSLFSEYACEKRQYDGTSHVLRMAGVFPLCGRGRINTYAVFAELFSSILDTLGRFGAILPTGIATDDTTKLFFQQLVNRSRIVSLFDFENALPMFPNVHRSYKFSLLTITGPRDTDADPARFVFFAHRVENIEDSNRGFSLSPEEIALLNPNTLTCPIFRQAADAEICKEVYRNSDVVTREQGLPQNPWRVTMRQGFFNMTSDSSHFREYASICSTSDDPAVRFSADGVTFEPLIEQNLINIYDHRFATFREPNGGLSSTTSRSNHVDEYVDPKCLSFPRFWVDRQTLNDSTHEYPKQGRWIVVHRLSARTTDQRSVIATIAPWCALGNSVIAVTPDATGAEAATFLGMLNSFALDYVARQKIGGMNLNFFISKQLPVIAPAEANSPCKWRPNMTNTECLARRVLELTYTAWDLEAFALDCGYDGPPFRWNEERRFLLRCELDAAYFHLYLGSPSDWGSDSPELREMFPSPRDTVEYIMETFPIVKKKDIKRTVVLDAEGEVTTEGTYITKDTILSIYDEMQQAIDSGDPYQTRLDPPPGPPADAEGIFIPMDQWDEANWPSHIHPHRAETNNESL
jgi:hypothetical protein